VAELTINPTAENIMLSDTDATATLAVKDLATARRFYGEILGLKAFGPANDEVIMFKCGNTTFNVYRSKYAGTNQATALTWAVEDVEVEVRELKARGVVFEHYDLPPLERRGDIHIADDFKTAWFKDPDGNILNIISE
jgi:catechol 2,3-dioxygenase-like lactoylglutathione lyase family enzyme